VQGLLLVLTRRPALAVGGFAVLFFPGVLLHELSHLVTARLLGVRTGRISLLPRPIEGGRLRLGYVETAPTNLLFDALIGAAPLITGGLFVGYAASMHLGLPPLGDLLSQGKSELFWQAVSLLPQLPDFWLWFYLAVTVSSTMFPSRSDQRGWLPVAGVAGMLVAIALLAGAGSWMAANLAPRVNRIFLAVALVFASSLVVHTVTWLPIWLLRVGLCRLLHVKLD
jgi:hypothetical protein